MININYFTVNAFGRLTSAFYKDQDLNPAQFIRVNKTFENAQEVSQYIYDYYYDWSTSSFLKQAEPQFTYSHNSVSSPTDDGQSGSSFAEELTDGEPIVYEEESTGRYIEQLYFNCGISETFTIQNVPNHENLIFELIQDSYMEALSYNEDTGVVTVTPPANSDFFYFQVWIDHPYLLSKNITVTFS